LYNQQPTALTLGARLGPYEIVAHIGAGGMGEVYRARDTNLHRDIALKILSDAFANDPDRLARFAREAQTLAALNHPNIAHIHGFEESEGVRALVMELVEGDDLSQRIERGAIQLDEALPIAKQIAEALEAAHEQGIIHRDLKPANIMVRPDGTVKVLDFGLAKAMEPVGGASTVSQSPTITSPAMTQAGMILGTAAYMSPEQARGKAVDKRADVWAFGAVLFEMLTGRRAFPAEDTTDTIVSVVSHEPDWLALPAATPSGVRRLLTRCLKKDAKDRLRDIGDAWRSLEDEPPLAPPVKPSSRLPWVAVVALAVIAAGVSVVHFREAALELPMLQYTLAAPEKTTVSNFAISPDGRALAFTATNEKGSHLWVRSLNALQPQSLSGTDGANYPFWSPDSRFIGFFAEGKLRKIAATGGPAQTLCEAPSGRGGTWNVEGEIVFAPTNRGGLSRVREAGGLAVPITSPETGTHRYPVFLPDGRRFLYTRLGAKENGVYLGSLDSSSAANSAQRTLLDESNARYVAPSAPGELATLLFLREGILLAQRVDPRSWEMKGDVVPVAGPVSPGYDTGYNLFSISSNGVLVYETGSRALSLTQHMWFDRSGRGLVTVGRPVQTEGFSLSPDDARAVIGRSGSGPTQADLWMYDLDRGSESRFTFDASDNQSPVWSPDGARVAFSSNRAGGVQNLYLKDSNGTGKDESLFQSGTNKLASDWSRDGKFIVFSSQDPKTESDLWVLPMTPGIPGDRIPIPLLTSEFSESMGQVSPNSRWLAYVSDETGRAEVYVRPFSPGNPTKAGKWQISKEGGSQPRWRADGKELFYTAPDRKMMVAEVKAALETFDQSASHVLFEMRFGFPNLAGFYYSPRADGQRLLMAAEPEENASDPLTVVVNWQTGSKR
jgi:serine/threonine protein kinase